MAASSPAKSFRYRWRGFQSMRTPPRSNTTTLGCAWGVVKGEFSAGNRVHRVGIATRGRPVIVSVFPAASLALCKPQDTTEEHWNRIILRDKDELRRNAIATTRPEGPIP